MLAGAFAGLHAAGGFGAGSKRAWLKVGASPKRAATAATYGPLRLHLPLSLDAGPTINSADALGTNCEQKAKFFQFPAKYSLCSPKHAAKCIISSMKK